MLIVMIMLRLWLVLSLSAAAPVNPTEEKEASVEIVIKSDALHSHSSENTNGYPRSIYIGGDVDIEIEGHNAQINLASIFSKDASPGTSTATTPTTASTATVTPKPEGTSKPPSTETPPPSTETSPPSTETSPPSTETPPPSTETPPPSTAKPGYETCDSGRTGAGCGKSTWIQKNKKDCWGECGRTGGSCPTFCGDHGYCCSVDYDDGCPAGAAEASPKYHTCVIQIAWRQKNEEDCWYKCGSKGGSCTAFCGDGGYCCRIGYGGCPKWVAEVSPKHHTCVIPTGVPVVKPYTPTPTKTECVCGQVASDRVIGGKDVVVKEFPWMAFLAAPKHMDKEGRMNKESLDKFGFCGGSLINDRWIVTASHCFKNDKRYAKNPDTLKVILGKHNLLDDDDTPYSFDVEKIILHHGYHPPPRSNDIALLKLKSTVDLNRFVPVCLPTLNDYTGKKATVIGWGKPGSSHILQKLEGLQVVNDNDCRNAMKPQNNDQKITQDMLCAGGEKGKDACQGDSGGPLHFKNDNQKNELIGVVSWGKQCGVKDAYGVYAETSVFVDWIKKTVEENGGGEYCKY